MKTPPRTHPAVIHLAAAIARRHPGLAAGCCGSVEEESPGIIQRWAQGFPSDLELTFQTGNYSGDVCEVVLTGADRCVGGVIAPAFARANAIRPGLGWELLKALDAMSFSHGLVAHPMSMFDLASNFLWRGETTQEGFIEAIKEDWDDEDRPSDEELAERDGPARFLEMFPDMHPDIMTRRYAAAHALKSAETYWRMAGKAASDWECNVLLALCSVSDFKASKPPSVWDATDGEFDHGSAAYFIRWDAQDDATGYWLDEVMHDIWDMGYAHDALLVCHITDSPEQSDTVVKTIEACRDHRQVMDQLLEVLLQAEEMQ